MHQQRHDVTTTASRGSGRRRTGRARCAAGRPVNHVMLLLVVPAAARSCTASPSDRTKRDRRWRRSRCRRPCRACACRRTGSATTRRTGSERDHPGVLDRTSAPGGRPRPLGSGSLYHFSRFTSSTLIVSRLRKIRITIARPMPDLGGGHGDHEQREHLPGRTVLQVGENATRFTLTAFSISSMDISTMHGVAARQHAVDAGREQQRRRRSAGTAAGSRRPPPSGPARRRRSSAASSRNETISNGRT